MVRALADVGEVRAPSRRGTPVAGAVPVTGDLGDRASVAEAWRGVDAVFLPAGYPDVPGLLADMRAAGVRRVVLLSTGAVVGGDVDNAVTRFNLVSEAALRDAGLGWAVLRPSGFMSNALAWSPLADVVREPFADVPVAVIDPADIGAVAARALTDPELEGRSLRLTGPEARARLGSVMPAEYVDAFFRFSRGGEYDDSRVTTTVPDLLGRPARTFRQWSEVHAGAF